MIRLHWILDDDPANYEFYNKTPELEYPYLTGYFAMQINESKFGILPVFCDKYLSNGYIPSDERIYWANPVGNELILNVFLELSRAFNLALEDSFSLQPFQTNLTEIIFFRDYDYLTVSERWNDETRKNRGQAIWTEIILYQDFCIELKKNIIKLVDLISTRNSTLSNNEYVKKLFFI